MPSTKRRSRSTSRTSIRIGDCVKDKRDYGEFAKGAERGKVVGYHRKLVVVAWGKKPTYIAVNRRWLETCSRSR